MNIPKKEAQTRIWDAKRHLSTKAGMVAYVEAAFEDGDPSVVAAALGDVARARGMSRVAKDSGLGRESLYKALSPGGNPEFATILRVLSALGMRFRAVLTR